MKITVELTELDYDQYVRLTERNAVAQHQLETTQEELEILAGYIMRAYQNPETGEPEKGICDSSYLKKARELAEKFFEKKYGR